MSTKTIIIWLGVAILLGGAALYVLRTPAAGSAAPSDNTVPAGERVLDIDPARVRAMTVNTPDKRLQRVEAAPQTGEWNLVVTDPSGATTTWPLIPARMRSILSLTTSLRAEAPADPAAEVGPNPTIVTFELDDGAVHTLRLADRTLGGTGLIEYLPHTTTDGEPPTPRRAMVADSFLSVFRNPGPRAWRDAAALPGVGPDASRIRLQNQDRSILLVRAGNRWNVAEPVRAPASDAKVAQVLAALQKLIITDFLDDRRPDTSITRLDNPSARITVETDQRLPAPDPAAAPIVRTRTQELHVGGPADSGGRNLFASIGPVDQGRAVSIDATTIASVLTTDPADYIAPTPTPVLPADVGAVSLSTDPAIQLDATADGPIRRGERRFKRSVGAWADVLADGRESQLADGDVNAVNELLTFLNTRGAQTVTTAAPDGYATSGAIVLASHTGAPLDTVEIGTLPSAALALRSGDVYRTFPAEAAPRLLRDWMTASGIRVGRPAPTPAGADADITK